MNVVKALRRCEVFGAMDRPELEEIATATTVRAVELGDVLVCEGQYATVIYVVVAGRFRVTDRSGVEVAQLSSGDIIGEISLIDDGPASADVTATRRSLVLELPLPELRTTLFDSSNGSKRVASVLARRLRNGNTRSVLRPPNVIAVSGGRWAGELCDALANAIPGARRASTVEETWELEPEHVVVVEARSRAVRADLEILVRDGGPPTAAALAPRRLDVRLESEPSAGLSPSASLSVRTELGDAESINRLVRIATGGAKTLVLGGGGWRTSATMGVLAELEAAGLEYDVFVGVSATSLAAMFLAEEKSAAEVTERTYQFARSISLIRDLGLTATSVTTGRSLTTAARQACGTIRLEELARPCVIGATNLTVGGLCGINAGLAWKAVRASASLPIVFPPMRIGAELLVDGGVVDNVPTSLAYALLPGPVVTAISVDRSADFDPHSYSDDGIARRAMVRRDRTQFLQVMTSCLRRDPGPIRCDHLISPDVGDSRIFDSSQLDEGLERGRIAGRAHVASLECVP